MQDKSIEGRGKLLLLLRCKLLLLLRNEIRVSVANKYIQPEKGKKSTFVLRQ